MKLILSFVLCFYMSVLSAQITHPKVSPASQIKQEVGLSEITINYSRPAVRGRNIFGGLVPYGRIWRVGANESTKITVDTDIIVQGKDLPKGTYALYAFPEANSWEVVFHKNTSHWGDGRNAYNPLEDAFRITVIPEVIADLQENFVINFEEINHNSVNMEWIWENTKVVIPIRVPTAKLMLAEIDKKIKDNPTAQTYYEAARYLQEEGLDYSRALKYLQKAISLGGDTYYFHRVKSLVEAALGDYKAAVTSAQRSLNLAQKEQKDEFVRMNQKNIHAWNGLIKRK